MLSRFARVFIGCSWDLPATRWDALGMFSGFCGLFSRWYLDVTRIARMFARSFQDVLGMLSGLSRGSLNSQGVLTGCSWTLPRFSELFRGFLCTLSGNAQHAFAMCSYRCVAVLELFCGSARNLLGTVSTHSRHMFDRFS